MQSGSDSKLADAYSSVSDKFRGSDVDLYATCRDMRVKSPVYEGDFIATLGVPTNAKVGMKVPTVALFRYADVMTVLRDGENYTSGFIAKGLGAAFDGLIILAMDGDEHRKVRSLLQPVFMPSSVNRWRDKIDRMIRKDFLEPLIPQKHAELMEFGLYFPIQAVYSLIGFPDDGSHDLKQYAAWALAAFGGQSLDPKQAEEGLRKAGAALKSLYEIIINLVVERRAAGATGDDLISRLINAEFEGRKLDDHEIATFVRSLLPAAGETTTRTFGSAMAMLLTQPGLLERVKADRGLIAKLIEETARFEPSSTFKVRQAAKEMEIDGVKIPAGALVQCMVASANRDETVFENPDVFDIDRKMKPSFGFGFGPHMCVGQFIAKLEINLAINAILDLFPNVRLDPSKPAPVISGQQLRGASSVAVIWD